MNSKKWYGDMGNKKLAEIAPQKASSTWFSSEQDSGSWVACLWQRVQTISWRFAWTKNINLKAQQFAVSGRWASFPWLLRRHSKVVAVLQRYM